MVTRHLEVAIGKPYHDPGREQGGGVTVVVVAIPSENPVNQDHGCVRPSPTVLEHTEEAAACRDTWAINSLTAHGMLAAAK